MTEQNQKQCPVCEGRKETVVFVCGIGTHGIQRMSCKTCEGRGWLSDMELQELQARKKKRAERRDTRLALSLTMREMAVRLGMSLVDYSSYEHGRIDL